MIPGRNLGQTLLFLAALALRAPAVAEPIEQTVEQLRNNVGEVDRLGPDFVHRPSGYLFPGKLGNLPARKTVTYGPGDASLYYTLFGGGNGDAWLTLYVFPVTRSFEDEVADVEQALLQRVSGISVEPPAGVPPLPTGAREKWFDGSIEGAPVVTGIASFATARGTSRPA
jgi:hypothetical protein